MLPHYLTSDALDEILSRGLVEDVGSGDVTTLATIQEGTQAEGVLLVKQDGIVAGIEVVSRVFRLVDPRVDIDWHLADGEAAATGRRIADLRGPARSLLSGERLALNALQRMSGIATRTKAMVDAVGDFPTRVLDTRKTAPGLRLLDKWAVLLGGGQNHRVGLFDMILIKDNHIAACGGIGEAISAARAYRAANGPAELRIEIEARTLAEVDEVLATGGVDVVLLDNMVQRTPAGVDTSLLERAVSRIAGRVLTEASGTVDIDTVGPIARTGVDFVSSGALTHSVRALDISLKLHIA